MQKAMDEAERRRTVQALYNEQHHITPASVKREVTKSISKLQAEIAKASKGAKKGATPKPKSVEQARAMIAQYQEEMQLAAENLDFETAIALRDKILALQKTLK